MNDEQVVEAMAARIRLVDEPLDSREFADLILAALRAAGFDVYRPDDCKRIYMSMAQGYERTK